MRRQDLEQKIHEWMLNCYQATYTGTMEVNNNDGIYIFLIGIPSYMSPTTIAISCDNDNAFLEYIYEELRVKNYMREYRYKVNRTPQLTER